MEKKSKDNKKCIAENQPQLTKKLIWIMAIASGTVTANLYYLQPVLYQLAADYHISQSSAGLTVTLTQIGLALGFFLYITIGRYIRETTAGYGGYYFFQVVHCLQYIFHLICR